MLLHETYEKFQESEGTLNAYLKEEFEKTPPLFYLSCDIRNSGQKISVVDTNLFPSGFNNLCKAYTKQAVETFRRQREKRFPGAKKLLIFSEAHTRNKFYFENLKRLSEILETGGAEVRVGSSMGDFPEDPYPVYLEGDKKLVLHRLLRRGSRVALSDGWTPDLIVSNNDFSSGEEALLQNIEQPVTPSMQLGWYWRKKNDHFRLFNQIAEEVAGLLKIDPWLISCISTHEENVDFGDDASLRRLADTVDQTLHRIRKKYEEYGIEQTPYVFVKNNSGTYGMGVTYVMSGSEILGMNRKTRNKMLSGKGGAKVLGYLIQEGIVTADFYSGYPIEPVIYLGEDTPVGGFFRLNEEKDEWSSLNTKGMAFSCLCLHKLDQPHEEPFLRCMEKETLVKMSFYLARLAALAAAREAVMGDR